MKLVKAAVLVSSTTSQTAFKRNTVLRDGCLLAAEPRPLIRTLERQL